MYYSYYPSYLAHHGVKGMRWGVRRYQNKDGTYTPLGKRRKRGDIVIDKGADVHRIVPKTWLENEKKYSGHAYASYKKEDTQRYRDFAKMFGNGDNYVDMTFKAKDLIVSPSRKKRVDEFVKLVDSDPEFRKSLIKNTRNPLVFVPKRKIKDLKNPKNRDAVYEKFAYLLVSKRDLRDPYFKRLESQGYSMVLDDADIRGGISKAPVIVFDRNKSLKFDKAETLG